MLSPCVLLCGVTRLIQEEKETTEQRAVEIESCVGSGSLTDVAGPRGSGGGGWPDRSFERASPPASGRSTPTPRPTYPANTATDYNLHKFNTVCLFICMH